MMRCASSILAVCLPVAAIAQPVDYRLLFDAIAAVESSRGATSANVYQIRRIYVLDVNRMTGKGYWYEAVTADERLARACMRDYWRCWLARTGAPVTYETLARMHNGGGWRGWRKDGTRGYWLRIRAELKRNGALK